MEYCHLSRPRLRPTGLLLAVSHEAEESSGIARLITHGGADYNIFRWYRSGWGRYTQADPVGFRGGINLYAYAEGDPVSLMDPLGLYVQLLCRQVSAAGEKTLAKKVIDWYKPLHCRLRVKCPCDKETGSGFDNTLGRENVNPKGSPGIYDTTKDSYSTAAYPPSAWSVTPVSGPTQDCQFEKCLMKAFNAQDSNNSGLLPKYNATGPNSNTFVANLITQCGGSAQFPNTAYGYDD